MTARQLCVIADCFVPGQHETDCDRNCTGCLPGLALDGALICGHHHRRGLFRLAEMPVFYDALCAGAVRRNSMITEYVSVSGDPGINLDDNVLDAKMRILDRMAELCAYVSVERGFAPPESMDVRDLGRYLARNASWMSANRVLAGKWTRQLDNIAADVRKVAYPSRPSGVFLGECPVEGPDGPCGARLWHEPSGYSGDPVTCRKCGTTQPVEWWRTALEPNLEAAAHLTAQALVPFLAWETNHPISEAVIRQWAARGFIHRHGKDGKGRTLYDRAAVLAYATDQTKEGTAA